MLNQESQSYQSPPPSLIGKIRAKKTSMLLQSCVPPLLDDELRLFAALDRAELRVIRFVDAPHPHRVSLNIERIIGTPWPQNN